VTGIPLRIAEPADRWRRSLRRFTYSGTDGVCRSDEHGSRLGHDASADLGDVGQGEVDAHGDNWPHDDERWPATCTACGYEFADGDQWQRNDSPVYRLPDGTEFAFRGSFGTAAPAGTMIRAAWFDEFADQPGESWLIALPDGGEWITTQAATGGRHWTVTGTPPDITASPSIWHNKPHGWHGHIRAGELVPA
jgi:Family of unknown function (DUF6527)